MNAKNKELILLVILLVGARVFDITTTWLYTLDLTRETNVLVKFLGMKWVGVIMVQAVLVVLVSYLIYFRIFRFKPNYPGEGSLTIKEFASYINFGNTFSFNKLAYSIPKNKQTFFAYTGYVVSMTLIASGYIIGTSTTLLLVSERYRLFYKHGIPTVLYVLIVCFAACFSIRFYQLEYKKYKTLRS